MALERLYEACAYTPPVSLPLSTGNDTKNSAMDKLDPYIAGLSMFSVTSLDIQVDNAVINIIGQPLKQCELSIICKPCIRITAQVSGS